MGVRVIHGDALEVLRTLPAGSGQCCVTSPPYWGLRDYGVAGQLGLEETPEEYVEKLVAILHEEDRELRSDFGGLWAAGYLLALCGEVAVVAVVQWIGRRMRR